MAVRLSTLISLPTCFHPCSFVDGGLSNNDPSMAGLSLLLLNDAPIQDVAILSIGTGSCLDNSAYARSGWWQPFKIIDLLRDAVTLTMDCNGADKRSFMRFILRECMAAELRLCERPQSVLGHCSKCVALTSFPSMSLLVHALFDTTDGLLQLPLDQFLRIQLHLDGEGRPIKEPMLLWSQWSPVQKSDFWQAHGTLTRDELAAMQSMDNSKQEAMAAYEKVGKEGM